MRKAIGIDLGGTRIKGIALDESGAVLHQHYTSTEEGDDATWKKAVLDTIQQLQQKLDVTEVAIGISAPGLINHDNTAIAFMPGRLQGLEHFDWSSHVHRPVSVLNDAVAAMMAEARLGAAQGRKNVVLLTLGTGVGGAILIDGKPYTGAFQKAGHLGHMVLDHEADQGITGIPGSLEDAIGNSTIRKRSLGKFETTHELLEAYRQGDHFAQWVWLSSVRKLAIGMATLTNVLSPECFVIAGGITEAGKDLFNPLEQFLSLYEWRTGGNRAEVLKASYGDLAGAVGAACFALENVSIETFKKVNNI
jgi:glucokinase